MTITEQCEDTLVDLEQLYAKAPSPECKAHIDNSMQYIFDVIRVQRLCDIYPTDRDRITDALILDAADAIKEARYQL